MKKRGLILCICFAVLAVIGASAWFIFFNGASENKPGEITFFKHSLKQNGSSRYVDDYELNGIEEPVFSDPVTLDWYSFTSVDITGLIEEEYEVGAFNPDLFRGVTPCIYDNKLYFLVNSIAEAGLPSNKIMAYDINEGTLSVFGDGKAIGDFFSTFSSIAVDKQGILYVLDKTYYKILCLDSDANIIEEISISNIADFIGGSKILTNLEQSPNLSDIAVLDNGDIYLSCTDFNRAQNGAVFRVDRENGVISAVGEDQFGVLGTSHAEDGVSFVNTIFRKDEGASGNGLFALHVIQNGELTEIKALPGNKYRGTAFYDGHYYLFRPHWDFYETADVTVQINIEVYDSQFNYIGEISAKSYEANLVTSKAASLEGNSTFAMDSEGNIYIIYGCEILIGSRGR